MTSFLCPPENNYLLCTYTMTMLWTLRLVSSEMEQPLVMNVVSEVLPLYLLISSYTDGVSQHSLRVNGLTVPKLEPHSQFRQK